MLGLKLNHVSKRGHWGRECFQGLLTQNHGSMISKSLISSAWGTWIACSYAQNIPIPTSIPDNIEVFFTCVFLVKVIYRHYLIGLYSTVLTSTYCSSGWMGKQRFIVIATRKELKTWLREFYPIQHGNLPLVGNNTAEMTVLNHNAV